MRSALLNTPQVLFLVKFSLKSWKSKQSCPNSPQLKKLDYNPDSGYVDKTWFQALLDWSIDSLQITKSNDLDLSNEMAIVSLTLKKRPTDHS